MRIPYIDVAGLEARLKQIDEEKEAILKLLSFWRGDSHQKNSSPKITAKSHSVGGRVVDNVIELIHQLGRQVGNKEILNYIIEKGTSLGDTKNKEAMLAAILSQEVKKKSARLKKVARGIYDIK